MSRTPSVSSTRLTFQVSHIHFHHCSYLVQILLEYGENGETALCVAAVAENVRMAKTMVKKNEAILTIPDSQGKLPLCKAALYGNHEMVKYLYNSSQNTTSCFWTNAIGITFW